MDERLNPQNIEMEPLSENPKIKHTFLYLLTFLGISAIAVGSTLILSDGNLPGWQLSGSGKPAIAGILISGAMLLLVFGILPCLLAFSLLNKTENKFAEKFNLFKDMHWAWSVAIYLASTLIIWVFVQMILQGDSYWLYWFYLFLAAVIILMALLPGVRTLYKK